MLELLFLFVFVTSSVYCDVTDIVIPPNSCLEVTASSLNVRSAPCSSVIIGSSSLGDTHLYDGSRTDCVMGGTTYNFVSILFNGQTGWVAADYLIIGTLTSCGAAMFPDPEFRAVWIATVTNIDWPSSSGLTTAQQQSQLDNYIDIIDSMNMNVIVFQIRTTGDAFYQSDIEPWSRYLTGTQGTAPNPLWDPLSYSIAAAHARGIEVHAWLNPYRASMSPSCTSGLAPNHMALRYPQHAKVYGNYCWMDPGAEVVVQHLDNVVQDIITRYDVDGIHFDDYFYPYPTASPFPDDDTYADYLASGGSLGLADWRRSNVNNMVARVKATIDTNNPGVAFTISPFGIYRPGNAAGMPPPIVGMDPYSEIYADSKKWLQDGTVDIFAPQLYWKIQPRAQSYPTLLDWWVGVNTAGRYINPGIGLYRMTASEGDWPVSEIETQIDVTRLYYGNQAKGHIHFSAKYFRDNTKGVRTHLTTYSYQNIVAVPPYPWKKLPEPTPPVGIYTKEHILYWQPDKTVKFWAVYTVTGNTWKLLQVTDSNKFYVQASGVYAVKAMNRANVQSDPVILTVSVDSENDVLYFA